MFTVIGRQPSADVIREIVQNKIVPNQNTNNVIHWGAHVRQYDDNVFTLNNVKKYNGLEQLTVFNENDLEVPAFTTDLEMAKRWLREGWSNVVWGRKLEHTRGNDIVGAGYKRLRNGQERFNPIWLNRDFWVDVINPELVKREWRVHIFQGRCIAKGCKVKTGNTTRRFDYIRSRNNGWTLDHTIELPDLIREASRKAVNVLGYNFGAVDILELNADGITFTPETAYSVLEVNSAPALGSQYTIDAYTKALQKIENGKYRKIYEGKNNEQ